MEKNNRRQMGIVNNIQRVQVGISNVSILNRNYSNSCNSTCIKMINSEVEKLLKKSRNRTCTNYRRTFRFLQYSFSGTQKDRRFKACNKLETPQSISQDRRSQDGHIKQGDKSSSPARFFSKCRNIKAGPKSRCNIHRRKILLEKGIVLSTVERISKLQAMVRGIIVCSGTARQYLQMLGLMASCIEVIPYARLQIRPTQLHLLY